MTRFCQLSCSSGDSLDEFPEKYLEEFVKEKFRKKTSRVSIRKISAGMAREMPEIISGKLGGINEIIT